MFKMFYIVNICSMKKIFILIVAFFCLIVMKSPFSLSKLSQNYLGEHTFYSTQKTNQKETNITKNGNGYLISTNSQNAKNVFQNLEKEKLHGESFRLSGTEKDIPKLLHSLCAKTVKEERFDDFLILYANSPKIANYVVVNNKKVNIQIAYKNKVITVGTPIILGSY